MVNHGFAAKLATDLLLLRSLSGLFSYRKFTSSLSAGIRALASTSFPGFSPTRPYRARERGSALVNIRRKALGHLMIFTQGRTVQVLLLYHT